MLMAGLAGVTGWVVQGDGFSRGVTGLFGLALLFVAVVLGWFVVGERYGRPAAALSPVERARLVREAEECLAGLAPAVILLSDKEREASIALAGVEGGGARDLLREIPLGEFWREFAVVSALVEEDPVRAIRELRGLRTRLEVCISGLDGVIGASGEGLRSVARTKG